MNQHEGNVVYKLQQRAGEQRGAMKQKRRRKKAQRKKKKEKMKRKRSNE